MSTAELRQGFRVNKQALARGFVASAILAPRISQEQAEDEDFVQKELYCLVDYIERAVCDASDEFANLYVGEKAKMAFVPGADGGERNILIKAMIEKDYEVITSVLDVKGRLHSCLERFFSPLLSFFEKPPKHELKVLFVGDCIHLDVLAFLVPAALRKGVNIVPEFVTDKNTLQRHKMLTELKDVSFDLVFYSPFSYEFHQPYSELLNKAASDSGQTQMSMLFSEVRQVMVSLVQTFECPLFVHNACAILRNEGGLKAQAKQLLSFRRRKALRREIDVHLDLLIDTVNSLAGQKVHKLDELHFAAGGLAAERHVGEYLYWSELQHPARIGMLLAEEYLKVCTVAATMCKKKMVVCDLDNTLWEGVIGEGAVRHYTDRQNVLKALKKKGVVLAIASKNDPKNVKWDGGVLNENDFAYQSINWEPKVFAFRNIERDLNLKSKDFVFIDDRADEREMVLEQHPEVLALDATSQEVWEQFYLWEKILLSSSAGDRTTMYLERAARNQFLSGADDSEVNQIEMYKNLNLSIDVRLAEVGDLARVEELINRTNQFNIQGSRVSKAQVYDMHNADDYRIWVVSMSDKFGDMGLVSVLIAKEHDDTVNVELFVLSCRVFGYDAEAVILNEVKAFARSKGKPVTGTIIETMYNAPCRKVFENNGFNDQNGSWLWRDEGSALVAPEWFRLTTA